jgi:hypothetical protein
VGRAAQETGGRAAARPALNLDLPGSQRDQPARRPRLAGDANARPLAAVCWSSIGRRKGNTAPPSPVSKSVRCAGPYGAAGVSIAPARVTAAELITLLPCGRLVGPKSPNSTMPWPTTAMIRATMRGMRGLRCCMMCYLAATQMGGACPLAHPLPSHNAAMQRGYRQREVLAPRMAIVPEPGKARICDGRRCCSVQSRDVPMTTCPAPCAIGQGFLCARAHCQVAGGALLRTWETAVTSCASANGFSSMMLSGTPREAQSSALSPLI